MTAMTDTTDTARLVRELRHKVGMRSNPPSPMAAGVQIFVYDDDTRVLLSHAAAALERLAAENADLRKDADRYRWWRSKQRGWSPYMDGTFAYTAGHLGLRGRTFDEAIDDAMADGNGDE